MSFRSLPQQDLAQHIIHTLVKAVSFSRDLQKCRSLVLYKKRELSYESFIW